MSMILLGNRAKDVAAKWKKTYFKRGKWTETIYGDTGATHALIIEAKGDREQINEAIGNESWTGNLCNSCGKQKEIVVDAGDLQICEACARRALRMIAYARTKGRI